VLIELTNAGFVSAEVLRRKTTNCFECKK